MPRWRRTWRDVDGVRVEGTWRPVFTRTMDSYHLTDLLVFADGAIDCGTGGLTDLDGLRDALRRGAVATALDEGKWASAHHVASWRLAEPRTRLTAEMLLGEIADEIDRLNNRPDSTARCLAALNTYLSDMSQANQAELREKYLAIPAHMREFALGDMDHKDRPLRVLITAVGEPMPPPPDGQIVTAQMQSRAVEYFRTRDIAFAEWRARVPADGPETPTAATLTLYQTVYPKGWPENPGVKALQNDYPATISVNGRSYPTVAHAYWALSTVDPAWHDQIADAPRGYDAAKLAEQAPRRGNWAAARLAVMARLLRAKYTQHPDLADTLLATEDSRIIYTGLDSAYWVAGGNPGGTNWIGRLLELIRSELSDADAPPPTRHAAPLDPR